MQKRSPPFSAFSGPSNTFSLFIPTCINLYTRQALYGTKKKSDPHGSLFLSIYYAYYLFSLISSSHNSIILQKSAFAFSKHFHFFQNRGGIVLFFHLLIDKPLKHSFCGKIVF